MSCILHHRGVQLILAYSRARPAILVAGKGRGEMFLFLLFLHFRSYSSFFPVPFFHLLYHLFYLFSAFLWETKQNDPLGITFVYTPTQSNLHTSVSRFSTFMQIFSHIKLSRELNCCSYTRSVHSFDSS